MHKFLTIITVIISTCITSAWGADTKKITVEWTLSLPDKNYTMGSSGQLIVYDQNGKCQNEGSDQPDKKQSRHLGISLISKQTQDKTTFICPADLQTLTVYFDFNGGRGKDPTNMAWASSADVANFTKTLDISKKKKHTIQATLETLYDKQQRLLSEAAQKFCTNGNFKYQYSNKSVSGTFCCVNGYTNTNTNALQNALDQITYKNSIKITEDCKNANTTPQSSGAPGTSATDAVPDKNTAKQTKSANQDATTQNSTNAADVAASHEQAKEKLNTPTKQPCSADRANGILAQELIDGTCYPSQCITPRWVLKGKGKKAKCVEQPCEIKHGTGEWAADGDTYTCKLKSCDTNKGWEKNTAETECIKTLKKCNDADKQKLESAGASKTGIQEDTKKCIATDCKCGYELSNGECVKWSDDKQCTADTKPGLPKNAKFAKMTCNDKGKPVCEITECISADYTYDPDKNKCTKPGEPESDGSTDEQSPTGTGTSSESDGTPEQSDNDNKSAQEPRLSKEDSLAKIDELKDNAQAMKDKEQSTANKLLGAAGIGATGIGGMQMASAMAEENADADAERAMRAYLATFTCNYGGGKNVPGGETGIELPGGNELIGLYSEYVNLANDLKVRKAALEMRPGIESESILDSATSGLYDDVSVGKTSGAYTSLARALMDPNGADAAAWAQQKSDTASKKKTGMITAGIGAAGSLIGNLAINSGKNKQNKVDEILNKYDKKKQIIQELQSNVAAIPPQSSPCPNGTIGTEHPNCTCNDTTKIYNPNTQECEPCSGGQTVQNGECRCPSDKPLWDTRTNQCIAQHTNCTPECTPTEGSHLIVLENCKCSCKDGFSINASAQCECVGENKKEQGGECVIVEQKIIEKTITELINTSTTTTVDTAVLPAGSLFKVGSYELIDAAKAALKGFVTSFANSEYYDCELTIKGYTDPLGGTKTNETLSNNRAKSVETYIKSLNNDVIKSITATGHGEDNCTCGAGKVDGDQPGYINGQQIDYSDMEYSACSGKPDTHRLYGSTRYAPCRRVEISANCKHNTTTVQTTTE